MLLLIHSMSLALYFLVAYLVAICPLRAIYYGRRWRRLNKEYNRYARYIQVGDNIEGLLQSRAVVAKLVHDAGVEVAHVPFVQAVGWGHVAKGRANVIDNLGSRDGDMFVATVSTINAAIGALREKTLESINPFFWVESLFLLPITVLRMLGAKGEGVFSKLATGVWWIGAVIAAAYQAEIDALIREVLGRIFH